MRIELTGGFYQARSIIANAQRCLNLYPEVNEEGAPVKITHYQTPGLTLLETCAVSRCRMLYTASNGNVYAVYGNKVYYISSTFTFTELGTIAYGTTPCYMADNAVIGVLVDGSTRGWTINITTNAFAEISDAAFYGATRVDYSDTYFIFNKPNTAIFYISPPAWNGTDAFDALDFASKSGAPDNISTIYVMYSQLWLIGNQRSSEIFYFSGATDFPFEQQPGTFIEHGIASPYSVAKQDVVLYWLSIDQQGRCIVLRGSNSQVQRISTHAIENEFGTYTTVSDAIGWTYQQEGHTFYVLTFPSADKTWVFDEATKLWHERCWIDENGEEHRIRPSACCFGYGKVLVGDWQDGRLYEWDIDAYTDDGDAIVRTRGFPHLIDDADRLFYRSFSADIQVGTATGLLTDEPPLIGLRWSDTRGQTWNNSMSQSLGSTGQYLTNPQWSRLGMARDRVFELSWSADCKTALNGAWIIVDKARS